MSSSVAPVAALARRVALLQGQGTALGWSSARALATASAGASSSGQTPPGPPKLVVFGGRGFVGSHVCAEAVASGLNVLGVSRAGTPPLAHERWADAVTWVRGNALEPPTFVHHLEGADAVVSCIGAFGSQEEMLKLNGTANVELINAAKAAGVKRFVYISAHIPNVPGLEALLGGYVRGKAQAEAALAAAFPATGVVLRPGVIYGDRRVSQHVSLPLGLLFGPIESLIARLPNARQLAEGVPLLGAAFVPPVSVTAVARAAVRAATDPAVPPGVIDVWELAAGEPK